MLFVILSLVLGVLLALLLPGYIPPTYTPYVAIAILAGLDSVFGGASAVINNQFQLKVFLSGFIGNVVLAALLTYIGNLLDVDIYLAFVIVFGTRILQNFTIIRRYLLNRHYSFHPLQKPKEEGDSPS